MRHDDVTMLCEGCFKEYLTSYYKRKHSRFCSQSCSSKKTGMKGKNQTDKQKKAVASINSKLQLGNNNSFWKGGLRTSDPKGYLRKWRQDNPLKHKTHIHKRRTAINALDLKTIQLVYENNIKRFGCLTCYLCLNRIEFGKDHLEHKTPLSRGGDNKYSNLDVSCQKCNLSKHDKTEEEFRKKVYREATIS